MSAHETQPGDLLASYPEFGLSCLVDDEDDPSEITVFPGEEDELSTTEWLTTDTETAVSVEEIR